ncbi:MAG: alanine--tRNA ligase [SAR202 cluster bacterium]|nr:alanine--tRNA ligase [SAR202 cluster bacterium]
MTGDQIRASYLQFFEQRGHLPMPSASLIPAGDPTLLFTSAGMVPFKPFFMGEQTPPRRRLTSCQKSFRTTDIDTVGDHKHLTFFEMLGNFSIGDYFKKDAITFAWTLVTGPFKLEPERIYVTVHLDDDEAFQLWHEMIGVPVERIYRYGDRENWWGPAGNEGPTGPCSELHYDFAPEKSCGLDMVAPDTLTAILRQERATLTQSGRAPIPGCHPNCDCERFVELWNLVFMQFYQDPQKNRTPLPAPSVDTGMGLERAAAILQRKPNVYETDLFMPILERVCLLTGKSYGQNQETDYALRVVAEHARAASFLIGDGVAPSNEGRGYVLRRIIRRAVRYGRRLGLTQPFLTQVAQVVLERFSPAYKELRENDDFIRRVIGLEEERFQSAIEVGLAALNEAIARVKVDARRGDALSLPAADAFALYDTYGFPPELTQEIAKEHGLDVDMAGFQKEMEAQRERARAAHAFEGGMEMLTAYETLGVGKSQFVGYSGLERQSAVAAILFDNVSVGHASQGQKVEIVLAETPFYPEGGGQTGDGGTIAGPNGLVRVEDTQSPVAGLIVHRGVVVQGDISLGEAVAARVEVSRRLDASRNHSGTHLLHAALRAVLGSHVRQAGSHVAPERLRFDFSHVSPLSPLEVLSVQSLANEKVRDNLQVTYHETSYAQAVREGALAFFGDRYGDVVRVVSMGGGHDHEQAAAPFSLEVCGGTHVAATGQVGTIFVLGESSVGGGMRRIEAVTGRAAEQLFVEQSARLDALARKLQTPAADLETRLDSFLQDNEQLKRRLASMERASLRAEAQELLGRVQDVEGVKVVAGRTSAGNADALREMGDFLKAKLPSVALVLAAVMEGNPILISMVTPDLVARGLHAGNIARDTAKVVGGGGGGRPEVAQAGGKQAGKLDDALRGVPELVRRSLKK